MSSIPQKIAYNVFASSLSKIISTVGALAIIAMITRYLGQEEFGWYVTALAFFMFFNAAGDWGLYQTSTREISRPSSNEHMIMSNVAGLRIMISLMVVLISPLIAFLMPYPQQLKISLMIVALAFLFASSSQTLIGMFQKRLLMDRVAYAELAGKILQVLLVYLGIKFDLGFNFLISTLVISLGFNFIIIYSLSRRFVKFAPQFDWKRYKPILAQSIPLGISVLVTFVYFKADSIILSLFQPASDVGTYGAAYKIIENLSYFPGMIVGLTMPMFAFNVFSNRQKFLLLINKNFKVFLILAAPLVIGTMFLAEGIINFIAGPEFVSSVPVLRIIIFSIVFIFFGHLFNAIMVAAKLQKQLLWALLVVSIFNVVLNLIFIPRYSFFATAYISVATEVLVVLFGAFIVWKNLSVFPSLEGLWQVLVSGFAMALFLWFFPGLPFFLLVLVSPAVYFSFLLLTGGVQKNEILLLLRKQQTL